MIRPPQFSNRHDGVVAKTIPLFQGIHSRQNVPCQVSLQAPLVQGSPGEHSQRKARAPKETDPVSGNPRAPWIPGNREHRTDYCKEDWILFLPPYTSKNNTTSFFRSRPPLSVLPS